METTAEKVRRISPCIPGLMLCVLWLVGEITGAIYWAIAGDAWAVLGSIAIPMFGAITLITEMIAG